MPLDVADGHKTTAGTYVGNVSASDVMEPRSHGPSGAWGRYQQTLRILFVKLTEIARFGCTTAACETGCRTRGDDRDPCHALDYIPWKSGATGSLMSVGAQTSSMGRSPAMPMRVQPMAAGHILDSMDLPAPRIVSAHGVVGLPRALPISPEVDEQLVAALRRAFPNVVLRQPPLLGAPATEGPRLILTSTSAQLLITAAQADFEVRFYGDFESDQERALAYVSDKLEAVRAAFQAVGLTPASIGCVLLAQFSFAGLDISPVEHILATHLRLQIDPDELEDTIARVGVKVRDKYFVSLRVANFEARVIQRPVMPGDFQPQIVVKPWEGELKDYGIGLTIDINNTLEMKMLRADPEITQAGVRTVMDLTARCLTTAGPEFVSEGTLSVDAFAGEPA